MRRQLAATIAAAAAIGLAVGVLTGLAIKDEGTAARPAVVREYLTPPACADGLHQADQIITTHAEALGIASDGFYAVADGDIDALTAATAEVQRLSADMPIMLDRYTTSRDACRRDAQ